MSPRFFQAAVPCDGHSAVGREGDQPEASIRLGELPRDVDAGICGGIIDDETLEITKRLITDALNRIREELRCIVAWDEDGNGNGAHETDLSFKLELCRFIVVGFSLMSRAFPNGYPRLYTK